MEGQAFTDWYVGNIDANQPDPDPLSVVIVLMVIGLVLYLWSPF